jgi:hypothetical protein
VNPRAREKDVLFHAVDDEMVVYDAVRKEAHRLNATLSKVWSRLDGERTIAEIAAEVEMDESVVSLSVDELASVELLEAGEALTVSRRAALRRVAGAAAVGFVLPAVTSIAAPMAAHAASGDGLGGGPPATKPPATKPPAKTK